MTATRGALAALAGVLLIPATAGAAGTTSGGAAAPAPGSPTVDSGIKLRTTAGYVGRVRIRGVAPSAAGRRVRVERRSRAHGWIRVGRARVDRKGVFRVLWKPRRSGRFRLRAVLVPASSSRRSAPAPARVSRSRRVTVYRRQLATWYGPGFYGNRTACGQRLTRRTVGVAHRRLRCGTKVAVYYRGRSLVVPVIDRGPFVRGVHWDLTAGAARRLGIRVTTRIGVLPLPPAR
jgi:rare lipoprotein A